MPTSVLTSAPAWQRRLDRVFPCVSLDTCCPGRWHETATPPGIGELYSYLNYPTSIFCGPRTARLVALTLIVAGCSLAVSVGGGLVDRKRPVTLLRVTGAPVGVLSRVVLLEAAVPLVAATVIAAAIAYGMTIMAFLRLAPAGTAVPQLGCDYYTIMGIGLAIAFGVITLTLPLLRTMTAPSTVRFE